MHPDSIQRLNTAYASGERPKRVCAPTAALISARKAASKHRALGRKVIASVRWKAAIRPYPLRDRGTAEEHRIAIAGARRQSRTQAVHRVDCRVRPQVRAERLSFGQERSHPARRMHDVGRVEAADEIVDVLKAEVVPQLVREQF